jgi:hypothetical protein
LNASAPVAVGTVTSLRRRRQCITMANHAISITRRRGPRGGLLCCALYLARYLQGVVFLSQVGWQETSRPRLVVVEGCRWSALVLMHRQPRAEAPNEQQVPGYALAGPSLARPLRRRGVVILQIWPWRRDRWIDRWAASGFRCGDHLARIHCTAPHRRGRPRMPATQPARASTAEDDSGCPVSTGRQEPAPSR